MVISPRFKTILKRTGLVLGILILLVFIALGIADYYISSHKDKVIAMVKDKVESSTGAQVQINDLDISIWRDFPRLRVGLTNVVIKDSVFQAPLLQFERIYTKINVFKAIFGNVKLGELRLVNGNINLLTDTSGYSNLSVFQSKKPKKEKTKDEDDQDLPVKEVYIENVHFVLNDQKGRKYYGIQVNKLNANVLPSGSKYKIDLGMNVRVDGLVFTLDKGPFLKGKTLVTNWNNMQFDSKTGDLTFDKSPVKIDDHVFNIGGGFNFSSDSAKSKLDLKIDSKSTTFADCVSLLASNLKVTLSNYTCSEKVDVVASLYGSLQQSTPHIIVKLVAPNNNVGIKSLGVELDSCSFIGNYDNQVDKKLLPDDPNSTIIIQKFKGNMTGVPFIGQKINIQDLKNPYIDMSLLSAGRLVKLNQQLNMQTINFLDGEAKILLTYKGRIPEGLGLLQNLSGEFAVHNGKAMYLPKQLLFENCNGTITFSKNNLKVDNLRATLNNNSIFVNIDGNSIVGTKSGQASIGYINCDINAPYLNLGYFSNLFKESAPSKSTKAANKKSANTGLAASPLQIDNLLRKGEFRLNINSKQIKYNNFNAYNFQTNIIFKDNDWALKKFTLNHAGGSIGVTGVVNPASGNNNKANVNLSIDHVQLDKLLYAFDNFGVNGLSYKNLKGTLTAKAHMTSLIDRNGSIIPKSSVGRLAFRLDKGQLLNYPPLLSIQKYVFKKRDLNNVQFANISDTIYIRHGNFFINRMEIASTALRLFVEGIYSPTGNSDISIQVPFSSLLKKKEKEEALDKTDPNKGAGASVYIRATSSNGGPMSIKLDIFKKLRKDNIKERFEKEFGSKDD